MRNAIHARVGTLRYTDEHEIVRFIHIQFYIFKENSILTILYLKNDRELVPVLVTLCNKLKTCFNSETNNVVA